MFLLTDMAHGYPSITKLYDTKDVGDVVTGITGDRGTGDLAETIAGYMRIGSEFSCNGDFKLCCVLDDEASTVIADNIEAVAHEKMTRCLDDYAERIWAVIKDAVICDVLTCTSGGKDGFSDVDVTLAIGRVIAARLGIEV